MRTVNFLADSDAHLDLRLGEQVIDLAVSAPQRPKTLGVFREPIANEAR